jgi:Tfp pilus assembly protein, tip-associated adhesin PilY1
VQINSFYGIRDQGAPVPSVRFRSLPNALSSSQPNNTLQPQSIIEENLELFGSEMQSTRTITSHVVDYAIQKGWYLDLVSPVEGSEGERVIGSPVVSITDRNDPLILFNSFIPSEGCESAGGRSILFALDPVNGARTDHAVFDLNEDGEYNDEDGQESEDENEEYRHDSGLVLDSTVAPVNLISSEDQTINHVITSELDGTIEVDNIDGAETSLGRQSWRQLR